MNQAECAGPAQGQALAADLSAVEIDVRCALALARIAVQTLAETSPEHQVRILNAIDDAIDGARLEEAAGGEAVVGLLTEFKLRLVETSGQTGVWYLD